MTPTPNDPVNVLDGMTTEGAKAKLLELVKEMLTAPPAKVPGILQRIQVYRLAVQLFGEIERGAPSEQTYRDIVLTARIMKQTEAEPGEAPKDETERMARDLDQIGLDQATALRLMSVFERVQSATGADDSGIPDTYDPDEPTKG